MNKQNTSNAPKVLKESKNRIKVDFERTSFWERMRLKFLSMNFLTKTVWWIFRLVLLLGISYVIILPFITKIASSFMSMEDFADVTVKLIPRYPSLDIYRRIIFEHGYLTALFNTTLLSVSCALIQMFVCCMIGYGLAKYKFKGSQIIFALVIFTMVVPHDTLRLSMFMEFRYFDLFGILSLLGGEVFEGFKILPISSITLTNTFAPLYILSVAGLAFKNGLYIFMMRQFFRGVPDELEESAYIDGSSIFNTFLKIVLPSSKPMMITIFLFAFSWQWTDNFYTNVFFTTTSKITLMPDIIGVTSVGTTGVAGLYNAAITSTCGLLIILPLIIVYLFCQRYLVQGIERSGITG